VYIPRFHYEQKACPVCRISSPTGTSPSLNKHVLTIKIHMLLTQPLTFEEIQSILCVISDFRGETANNWALLCCYAPSRGNFLPKVRENISVRSSGFKNLFGFMHREDGNHRLSLNFGKELPLLGAE